MKSDMQVSIIVLSYKDFRGIHQTIESVLEQTYDNIEVIVSDDGSENFNKKDFLIYEEKAKNQNKTFILHHNKQNLGTVKNINGALELAHGDVIGFLGAGDYYVKKNVIEEIVNYFICNMVEVVAGKMCGISSNTKQQVATLPEKELCSLLREGNHQQILNKMFNENCFCAPATFYKRKVYQKYGKYDERMKLIEDYPFLFKLVLNKAKIGFFDDYVTNYILDGVSSKKPSPIIQSDMKKIRKYVILPHIDKCQGKERRLFLYNFQRRYGSKLLATFKYPDKFLYWQAKRVKDILKIRGRK